MKSLTFPRFVFLAALLALGYSDTLRAQPTITVATNPATSPTTLTFNPVPVNSTGQAQNLFVSSTSNGTSVIAIPSQSWITISQVINNVGTTPVAVPVNVNTQGLAQGFYSGTISFAVSGTNTVQQTVVVNLTVSSSSVLSANPSSVSFTAQQGSNSATPSSTRVVIASSGAQLNYTVSAQPSGSWLLVQTGSNTTGDPNGFLVFANPTGLAAGNYTGTITVQSTTTSDSVQIPVTLAVTANPTLSVSPSTPPPFLWQIGTPNPAAQQLTVSSSAGNLSFSVSVPPQVNWLVVSPVNGTTPGTISLIPTPGSAGLGAGTYTTNVTITAGGNQVAVPVTLVVTNNPILQLSTTSLTYSAQFGAVTPPADQSVTISATSPQGFNFSSDSSWLTASSTGTGFSTSSSTTLTTPTTLIIRVNPAGLPLGTSTGKISIRPANGDNYTETITVALTLTSAAALQIGPQSLLFSYQTGQQVPFAQGVLVTSTGQPLTFTVSVPPTTVTANCPANWLTASPSSATTPATVAITVSVAGMTPGLCSGQVSLSTGPGSTPQTINVTTAVSAAAQPELVVNMPSGFGVETAQLGGPTIQRIIPLTRTDNLPATATPAVDFTATSSTPWLFLSPTVGNAPANLAVVINTGALTSPGTYNGSIVISSSTIQNFQLTVPVTLTITPNVSVTASPTALTFSQAQGGPVPPSQTVTLTATGGTASFIVGQIQYNTGANWLQVTPSSGTTANGAIQVTVQPNSLSQGQYTATIPITISGASPSTISIPVTLNVGPAQTLTASPSSLNFAFQLTGTNPASQTITVTSTGGPVTFNVGTTASPSGWLNTDIASGTTGGSGLTKNIVVTVNPQGLSAATYNGSISISAPGVLASPISIPVTLVVSAAPVPQPATVRSGASFVSGVIAPGELISIFGLQMGPTTGVNFKPNSSGGFDPILAGVRVLFGGVPGTPTYASATQINVVVPWELAGQLSTNMTVEFNGVQSAPITLGLAQPVNGAQQAPGLFTSTQNGAGQLAAINQNGTYNGTAASGFAPAPIGSVIAVYGTGGPQTNPPSRTGTITPIPRSPADLLNITGATATVGGLPATVQFAGGAPGLVTGVFQANIQIPAGVTPGPNVPISLSFNGVSTPVGTSIAVQ